jgi:hypothetical protein
VLRRIPLASQLHPEELLLPRLRPRLQVICSGKPDVFCC